MTERYCGPCDKRVGSREIVCKKCGADTERIDRPKLTRQEQLEGLADRGIDTWDEYYARN